MVRSLRRLKIAPEGRKVTLTKRRSNAKETVSDGSSDRGLHRTRSHPRGEFVSRDRGQGGRPGRWYRQNERSGDRRRTPPWHARRRCDAHISTGERKGE